MTFLQIASKVHKENKSFFCHLSESGFQTILNTNFIDFINILKMPLKNMLKMFLFTPFYGTSLISFRYLKPLEKESFCCYRSPYRR